MGSAEHARDEALRQVEQHADEVWWDAALRAVLLVARRQPTFTADDVWDLIPPAVRDLQHEPRALGAVLQRARKMGRVMPTGDYQKSKRKSCHARPIQVWAGTP